LSYHYYIERDGKIIKMVDPKYEASHAGASLWRSYLRMNKYSIGICLQNNAKQKYTEDQYVSLAWLIKSLQRRFKDDDSTAHTILGHEDVATPRGRKEDPGEYFEWNKLYSLLGYNDGNVRRN
jgi:N-acetyl-anhydromuramyl-L-alanine amidase AmpD